MIFFNQKALSIIEVLASMTILVIVAGTYGSTARAKQEMLRTLKMRAAYQRLADVQLERVLNVIHRGKTMSRSYASAALNSSRSIKATTSVSADLIFSFEGRTSGLDAYNAANVPKIPLLQLQIHGMARDAKERFLSFPYPNELKYGFNPEGLAVVNQAAGTFHNITGYLRDNHPDVLPRVSEEFLVFRGDGADFSARFDELGWKDSGATVAEELDYSPPIPLLWGETADDTGTRELVRRYVYYRKIREGNLVFGERRGFSEDSADIIRERNTDVDELFIQHLNSWTTANRSSANNPAINVRGTAIPEVGPMGAHSIFVMVVVRARHDNGNLSVATMTDDEFLKFSSVKAVAVGIATPTYNKNVLDTRDLDYHRYDSTRIPGIRPVGM